MPPRPTTLWVRSDVLPDGSYAVAIDLTDDRTHSLSPTEATAYGLACITLATEAEHDAATFRLLRSMRLPEAEAARLLVSDIRPGRPDARHAPTAPLKFIPGLNSALQPFLTVELDGVQVSQLTPAELADHGKHVLRCLAATRYDHQLHTLLAGPVGLGDGPARQVVSSLADHWPPP